MTLDELESGIAPETLTQLRAVPITPGRPLIAVDADEVMVVFVAHLDRYMRTQGYEMRLTQYQLEGSMFPIGSSDPLPFDACIEMINRFFQAETLNQQAVPDGPDVLARLAKDCQIVILTNVPRKATEARRQNLTKLGFPYPLVVNSGGKGRAMAWLAAHAAAPTAFIDDSVKQIESVAKHASDVVRLHFAWADFISNLFPECADATEQVRSWPAAETALRKHLLRQ